MKKIKTPFKGLLVYKGKRYNDKRGFLREVFQKYIIKKNLVFSVTSSSKKNVLRGLHLQTKKSQDKYVTVLKGKILVIQTGVYSDRLFNMTNRWTTSNGASLRGTQNVEIHIIKVDCPCGASFSGLFVGFDQNNIYI